MYGIELITFFALGVAGCGGIYWTVKYQIEDVFFYGSMLLFVFGLSAEIALILDKHALSIPVNSRSLVVGGVILSSLFLGCQLALHVDRNTRKLPNEI